MHFFEISKYEKRRGYSFGGPQDIHSRSLSLERVTQKYPINADMLLKCFLGC